MGKSPHASEMPAMKAEPEDTVTDTLSLCRMHPSQKIRMSVESLAAIKSRQNSYKSTLLPVMYCACSLGPNVWRTPGIILSETPIFQDFLPRCCTVLCLLTVTTHTHDFEDKEFCSAIGKKKGLRLWIFKFHLIIDEWRYHCDLVRSNMTLASIYNRNFMV